MQGCQALPYLGTYLGSDEPYLGTYFSNCIQAYSIPLGEMGAKTVYLHNRIWKQQQQPWLRCERTSRFLEALTSNNPPGHPESKTRQPPRIQTFKRSAFDLPTYLPTLRRRDPRERRTSSRRKGILLLFFPLDQTTLPTHEPTRHLPLDYLKEIIKPHLD